MKTGVYACLIILVMISNQLKSQGVDSLFNGGFWSDSSCDSVLGWQMTGYSPLFLSCGMEGEFEMESLGRNGMICFLHKESPVITTFREMIEFSKDDKNGPGYLTARLNKPLAPGKVYRVYLDIMPDKPGKLVNLPVSFLDANKKPTSTALVPEYSIQHYSGGIRVLPTFMKKEWHSFYGTFKATGKEEYIRLFPPSLGFVGNCFIDNVRIVEESE